MIKNIIFDFDGVILNSMHIKTKAFERLFHKYPKEKVKQFIDYHLKNGGVSRYKKIKYFFEKILNTKISENDIIKYAEMYSKLTKEELSKNKYLIKDTIEFIKDNYKKYNMHIASGADEEDLKYICKNLEIDRYFISIHGSPKEKYEIIKFILNSYNYIKMETILIGDTINDYEAAKKNEILFYAYNNPTLKDKGFKYLHTLKELENVKKI